MLSSSGLHCLTRVLSALCEDPFTSIPAGDNYRKSYKLNPFSSSLIKSPGTDEGRWDVSAEHLQDLISWRAYLQTYSFLTPPTKSSEKALENSGVTQYWLAQLQAQHECCWDMMRTAATAISPLLPSPISTSTIPRPGGGLFRGAFLPWATSWFVGPGQQTHVDQKDLSFQSLLEVRK